MTLIVSALEVMGQERGHVALIDASGSMRGFYTAGSLASLSETLRALGFSQQREFSYQVVDGVLTGGLRPFDPTGPAEGSVTLLGRALREYLEGDSSAAEIVIVTDNIQDAGGLPDEQRDIEDFYEQLRSDPVISAVFVIPLRLDFDGFILRRNGVSSLGDFRGQRGLAMYVLSVGRPEPSLPSVAPRLADRFGAPLIRMKPFDTAPVRAEVDTRSSVGTRPAPDQRCLAQALRPDSVRPNVLVGVQPIRPGEAVGGMFAVSLRSELEGVSLSRPLISGRVIEDFRLSDFHADGTAEVITSPPSLSFDFAPGDSTTITTWVCFPEGVRFAFSRGAFWRLATNRSRYGSFQGRIELALEVPRARLLLSERVAIEHSVLDEAFFESLDPALHGRVYGLELAFRELATDSVEVVSPLDYAVAFAVPYPLGPVLLVIMVGLTSLGFVLLMAREAIVPHVYALAAEGEGRYVFGRQRRNASGRTRAARDAGHPDDILRLDRSSPEVDEEHRVAISLLRPYPLPPDRGHEAKIWRVPVLGALVVARHGYRVDERSWRWLRARGDRFRVQEKGAAGDRQGRRRAAQHAAEADPLDPF